VQLTTPLPFRRRSCPTPSWQSQFWLSPFVLAFVVAVVGLTIPVAVGAEATDPDEAASVRKRKPRPQERRSPPVEDDAQGGAEAGDEDEDETGRNPKHGATVRASTEVSAYTDSDYVHVVSPTLAGSVGDELKGWSVGARYLIDAVSAASVDIVSTASHHWVENRHVGSASADFKAGGAGVSLAGGFSREPDYLSLSGGGLVSFELFDKNVMPFFGGSYGNDQVGRTGEPRSFWRPMNKVSLKTGATFVVNRSTIASLSVDAIFERGYLAKPYRYLPLFAPGTAATIPAGASIDLVRSMNQFSVDENAPAARDRFAVAGRLAHRLKHSTFRGDQRVYHDGWGLWASTTDIHHFIDLGRRFVFWPHGRFHAQRGVDFWRRALELIPNPTGGPPGIPVYRAGDRELGPLYTLTGGFGIRALLSAEPRTPWALTLQIDAIYTRYLDALYISQRRAFFGALSFEAGFD